MSLAGTLNTPYAGTLAASSTVVSATTSEVPGKFDVALDGHGYIIDQLADLQGFRSEHFERSSVPMLRAQADTAAIPAEQSINRESLWRRSQESWHHGSNQTYFDRADSDNQRFRASKGVNVWTKWTLSLLNDTAQARASANTNVRLTNAGTFMYLADGNNLLSSSNITSGSPTFTTVTGTPASSCLWIVSDGFTIYSAYATAIYTTTRGAATAASFSTGFPVNISTLGYVKGRLMAAAGNAIYNVTAAGAAPAALLTHANTDFTWVGFAEGQGFLYAAGFSGTRSLIYKITIQPDGTALTAPSVAGELPTGETVRTVKGYLGVLLVGTDLGFRLGTTDSAGNITFGSLIPTLQPVLNFEPADKFVYYTLSNPDSVSTGLGRLDLSQFNQPLTPAYASDLMVTGQGSVQSISSSGTTRVFAISGLGFYTQTSTLVPSGTLATGRITYGVADDKVAMYLDLRHQALSGQVSAQLTSNDSSTVSIGSSTTPGSVSSQYALSARQTRAEFFELTLTLSAATSTTGPTVTRTTLRAYPAPSRSLAYTVPLILHYQTQARNGTTVHYDVNAERAFLEGLVKTQRLITYQEGSQSYQVVVEDFKWVPIKRGEPGSFDGTFVVKMKEQLQ